jgi:hypothetical protein
MASISKNELKKGVVVEDDSPFTSGETDTGSVFIPEPSDKATTELDTIQYDHRRGSWGDSHSNVMVDQVFHTDSSYEPSDDAEAVKWQEENFDFTFKNNRQQHSIASEVLSYTSPSNPQMARAPMQHVSHAPVPNYKDMSDATDLAYSFDRMNMDFNGPPLSSSSGMGSPRSSNPHLAGMPLNQNAMPYPATNKMVL